MRCIVHKWKEHTGYVLVMCSENSLQYFFDMSMKLIGTIETNAKKKSKFHSIFINGIMLARVCSEANFCFLICCSLINKLVKHCPYFNVIIANLFV